YERDFFPLPEPQIFGEATRVMSLRDGTKKMSKSDTSDYSRINMTDDADAIALKIRRAKTDPEPLPDTLSALEQRPEADNLVSIYAALSDMRREAALARFAGANFSTFKEALSGLSVDVLGRIGGEMRRLMADPGHIDRVLRQGADRRSLAGRFRPACARRGGRLFVRRFRRGRRVSFDPIADLYRRARTRRGRVLRQPAGRRLIVRRHRALAAGQCRFQDGICPAG